MPSGQPATYVCYRGVLYVRDVPPFGAPPRGLYRRTTRKVPPSGEVAITLSTTGIMIADPNYPNRPRRWRRSHVCVLLVDCPHCKSRVGAPCRGTYDAISATHCRRRDAARGLL